MEQTYTTIQKNYKLHLYFIGGTVFSTNITSEGLNDFKKIIQNPNTLKRKNYIIEFGDTHGVNIRNLNAYEIEEAE